MTTSKQDRTLLWAFLAVQLIFAAAIIIGIGGRDIPASCAGEADVNLCIDISEYGSFQALLLAVGLWFLVDAALLIGYAIHRRRARHTVTERG